MVKGLLLLLIFQFIGESIAKLFTLKIPGAIIGLILLLIFLSIRKKSFNSLDSTVNFLLKYLLVFIIPAALGIITQVDEISKEFVAITISLFFGTIISIALSAKIMDILIEKRKETDGY